jgi:hypothetical protein
MNYIYMCLLCLDVGMLLFGQLIIFNNSFIHSSSGLSFLFTYNLYAIYIYMCVCIYIYVYQTKNTVH